MPTTNTSRLRLALAQVRVEGGDIRGNLMRAAEAIRRARAAGADVVLLPEALDCGWTDPSASEVAQPIPGGSTCTQLASLAHESGLWLCAGLTERLGPAVYNAAVLLDPTGAVRIHHRKIYELGIAHSIYAAGDSLRVAETPWGRLGLMICADAFAPGQALARTLGFLGAGVILSPCAWAVPSDHDPVREPYGALWRENYGPVARDFQLWIAGCSNVGPLRGGPWAGRRCIGCSLVVGPDGEPRLTGPYGVDAEALLTIDLDIPPRPARGDEWEAFWAREEVRRLDRGTGRT